MLDKIHMATESSDPIWSLHEEERIIVLYELITRH